MAKTAEPWEWAGRPGWYAWVKGKRRRLTGAGATKTEARLVLRKILAEEDASGVPRADALDLHALIDLFLRRVERECKPSTLTFYKNHLEPFGWLVGAIPSGELRPKHLDHFLATNGEQWSDSTRRGAITAVKAMTAWSFRKGYLQVDPMRGEKRPKMGRREAVDPRVALSLIKSAGDQPFEDLLIALFESGCRPGEVYKVTAEDVDLRAGTWTVHGKTTDRTGRDRVIYLTPRLAEITRRLALARPSGPIFRNSDGNKWTNNAVRCRFLRRREALGPIQAYGLRHLFGTDALTKLAPGVVASLMGHSDLKMLLDHYGHVEERSGLLRDAVASVRPGEAGTPAGADESLRASA